MQMAVDATGHLTLARHAQKQQVYYCPTCGQPLMLRRGQQKPAYFAHQRACTPRAGGETAEHQQGKQQIMAWATRQGWQPQAEVYLPMIQQRPDVLVTINSRQCPELGPTAGTQPWVCPVGDSAGLVLGPTLPAQLAPGKTSAVYPAVSRSPVLILLAGHPRSLDLSNRPNHASGHRSAPPGQPGCSLVARQFDQFRGHPPAARGPISSGAHRGQLSPGGALPRDQLALD